MLSTGTPHTEFDYEIDALDTLSAIGPGWSACYPADIEGEVIGRSLWDFIDGAAVREFYRHMLKRARQVNEPIAVPYRCDSASHRRFMRLEMTPVGDGRVRFASRLLREEERPSVPCMDPAAPRNGRIVVMCSMCKRVKRTDGAWVEVEEAIDECGPDACGHYPMLSHGLCPGCFDAAVNDL